MMPNHGPYRPLIGRRASPTPSRQRASPSPSLALSDTFLRSQSSGSAAFWASVLASPGRNSALSAVGGTRVPQDPTDSPIFNFNGKRISSAFDDAAIGRRSAHHAFSARAADTAAAPEPPAFLGGGVIGAPIVARPAPRTARDQQAECLRVSQDFAICGLELQLQIGNQHWNCYCIVTRAFLEHQLRQGMRNIKYRHNIASGSGVWEGGHLHIDSYGYGELERDFQAATGLEQQPGVEPQETSAGFKAVMTDLFRQELLEHSTTVRWDETLRLIGFDYGRQPPPPPLFRLNGVFSILERVVGSLQRGLPKNRAVLEAVRQMRRNRWERAISIFGTAADRRSGL